MENKDIPDSANEETHFPAPAVSSVLGLTMTTTSKKVSMRDI